MIKNVDYDALCKRVLCQKWVLARLLKTYLEEYEDCTLNEIIQLIQDPQLDVCDDFDFIETRNTEDNTGGYGRIYFDVLLYARLPNSNQKIGMIINLEAQSYEPSYPILKRGIYYLSRLIAAQKGKSPGFRKSEYGELKKVVGIWIYNQGVKKQGMVNVYEITEEIKGKEIHLGKEDYDLMKLVILSPKEETDGKDEMMDIVSLLFGNKGVLAKDTLFRLEKEYGIVMTREESEDIEKMCNWSVYKYQQGYEDGCKATYENSQRDFIIKMLKKSMSVEIIEEITGASLVEIEKISSQLQLSH
ncbi:MAG: hypothetical protein IJ356_11505 [Erysipelotrichaceae bacterium]|nr:hypothetical protein [Erysipelotrichaceae bacterium]